jgi:hypothetical protein
MRKGCLRSDISLSIQHQSASLLLHSRFLIRHLSLLQDDFHLKDPFMHRMRVASRLSSFGCSLATQGVQRSCDSVYDKNP